MADMPLDQYATENASPAVNYLAIAEEMRVGGVTLGVHFGAIAQLGILQQLTRIADLLQAEVDRYPNGVPASSNLSPATAEGAGPRRSDCERD